MNWQTATNWVTTGRGGCAEWSHNSISRLPGVLKGEVARSYLAKYNDNYLQANQSLTFLNKLIEQTKIDNQPLKDHFDEDRLRQVAESKIDFVKYYRGDAGAIQRYIENIGIKLSDEIKKNPKGLAKRALDRDWWVRQLRKVTSQSAEQLAIAYGLVNRKKAIYCSNFAVERYRKMKARNNAMLENILMVNEQGFELSLKEIHDKSIANPALRRAELMTRIRGFDDYAKAIKKAAVFVTLTAPSKYHANSIKYNGATPKETQDYINKVWARIRAKLAREEIEINGFRVAEPHHDGTPHAHYLLFVEPNRQKRLVNIFDHYALQEDGSERGARKARLKVEFIDRKKGSAVSYIAKYISKNIDGYQVGADLYGKDATTSAERIAAWASIWGIRQFQQIGGIPVTIWRTLRRIETEYSDSESEAARSFADSGDWHLFTIHANRAALKLYKVEDEGENRYGEPLPDKVMGVLSGSTGEIGLKIFHQWKARERPRTRVNNCTVSPKTQNYTEQPPPEIH